MAITFGGERPYPAMLPVLREMFEEAVPSTDLLDALALTRVRYPPLNA